MSVGQWLLLLEVLTAQAASSQRLAREPDWTGSGRPRPGSYLSPTPSPFGLLVPRSGACSIPCSTESASASQSLFPRNAENCLLPAGSDIILIGRSASTPTGDDPVEFLTRLLNTSPHPQQ
jgi:hypothetical protein